MQPDRDPHGRQPLQHLGPDPKDAAAVVILVHGRGATAESILELGRELDVPDVAFIAPQAANTGFGPSWYPNSFLAPLGRNEPWLSSALALVDRIVEDTLELGVEPSRLLLAGFSQGACLATEYAARYPDAYGGVVALSGGLIGNGERPGVEPPADKTFEYGDDLPLEGVPVFMGCSDRDAHIPVERLERSAEVFQTLGAMVDLRIYEGMGHTVNEDEIEAFRLMIEDAAAG